MAYLQLDGLGLTPIGATVKAVTQQWIKPKLAKEARKERLQQSEIAAAEAERGRFQAALEARRKVLQFKLDQLQRGARASTAVINKIRDDALQPELQSVPGLVEEVLIELEQWEAAVLEVQGAGAGSTASVDMEEMNQAIGDVQAALGVINAIQVRSQMAGRRMREALELRQQQELDAERLRKRQKELVRQEQALLAQAEEEARTEREHQLRVAELQLSISQQSEERQLRELIRQEEMRLEQAKARLRLLQRQRGAL